MIRMINWNYKLWMVIEIVIFLKSVIILYNLKKIIIDYCLYLNIFKMVYIIL